MSIFHRVTDILSANLNDLVDRFEDPEKMLRQAVREMDESIADAMDGAARAIATEKLLEKELEKRVGEATECRERAQRAVQIGDDASARVALRQERDAKMLAEDLRKDVESARAASLALRRQIDGLRAKLMEAKRKLASLSARQRVTDAKKRACVAAKDLNTDPFRKFERFEERIEHEEAAVDALAGFGSVAQEDDQVGPEIEAELARLKGAREP